ncbi:glycosyltransferase [Lacibacter luteus]|uniref:Glycosyltransferase n=1 Tax=Lacibacter luteus TaxID=2508719 RepID=A0A4V1M6Z1_9BACT|nr:glycosyltransferase [Lacibacter luteus]
MNYPKISIVTASYNQGHFIEETIQSVLNQNYPNLEYIIIDGGSTDHTVEVIKKYQQHLTYWVSEKDKGQANAINKGLQLCTGEIFNWLNSDDYLEPEALHKIATAFADEAVQMVAGKVRNFSTTEEEIIPNQNLNAKGLMCWEPGVKFVQPGVWMRRELIAQSGGIDEQFHYAFDWDLYIRYLYRFPQVKELDELLVHFRLHENSKTQSLSDRFTIEERKIIEKIFQLPAFKNLHAVCDYKIQKTKWTAFLSELSKTDQTFLKKAVTAINKLHAFPRVSYSRQTAGALRAFWEGRAI